MPWTTQKDQEDLLNYGRKKAVLIGSGSARFWLPGSGSAKICGSTDPDPRDKISTKKNFIPKPKSELLKKEKL